MIRKQLNFLAALVLGAFFTRIGFADDIDIYAAGSDVSTSRGKPNILFIIDTSGSMTEAATGAASEFATYDKAITYLGDCNKDYFWFTSSTPSDTSLGISCGSNQKVLVGKFHCGIANDEIAAAGFSEPRWYFQWRASGTRNGKDIHEWQSLTSSPGAPGLPNTPIDCKPDTDGYYVKEDGILTTTEDESVDGAWSTDPGDVDTSSYSTQWRFYTANYMNWFANYKNGMNRITAVKHALTATSTDPSKQGLLRTLSDVSIGFMQFDGAKGSEGGSNGGMVIKEVVDLSTSQAALIDIVNAIEVRGDTPLAETLVEGVRYYMGGKVYFGDMTRTESTSGSLVSAPSVATSRNPLDSSSYSSPIIKECQMNHIVFLTDGEPTYDSDSDNAAELFPGWNTQGPTGKEWTANCRGSDDDNMPAGSCLDDIAAYAYQNDLSDQSGMQRVITHMIGFDIPTAAELLQATAEKGGNDKDKGYYPVTNTKQFKAAVQNIVKQVIDLQSSFNAPAVSVNAFNRTRHSNNLYFTLFAPQDAPHWDGNLKKFEIEAQEGKAVIVGADGQPAVNPDSGFFKDGAKSFWTPSGELPDGGDAAKGGASSMLPANRRIYTDASSPGSLALSSFDTLNAGITYADLGVTSTARNDHINWIRGFDVDDKDTDGNKTEPRLEGNMGDPLHSRPAVITYGGTEENPDSIIYFGTNDGFLHAVDANTGIESFAFIPKFLWPNFKTLRPNPAATSKIYGIDTPIVPLIKDVDSDGVIELADGDFAHIYFGLRRGGRYYYALDVTDRSAPRLLWVINDSTPGFNALGYTFAEPARGRVLPYNESAPVDVLFLSGGFDTSTQDNDGAVATVDTMGNALFVVNAESGTLLWSAGETGSGASLEHDKMTSSMPAPPRVIDLNGDGITDRAYVGDMGGRVWRFDVHDVQTQGSNNNLLSGGVIASLGAAHLATPTIADHRQFMNTPDVALVDDHDLGRYLTVGLGSGERQHPNHKDTLNRFYVLKDPSVDAVLSNSEFPTRYGVDGVTHQQLNALIDLTSTALDEGSATDLAKAKVSKGWFMDMPLVGEKVLAEAVTVRDQLMFTSFTPTESSGSCDPGLGLGKVYVISLKFGSALFDQDGDGDVDEDDRSKELKLKGIPPGVTILFPEATGGEPDGRIGPEPLPVPLELSPKRTYWYEITEQ